MATFEKKPYITVKVESSHQNPMEARKNAFIALGLSDSMKEMVHEYKKVVGKE
jgi:hypothetical protein